MPVTGKITSVLLPGSWSGVECKALRFDVGVMQEIGIVIHYLHGLAAPDGQFPRLEGAPLLGHLIGRRAQGVPCDPARERQRDGGDEGAELS